MLAGGVTFSNFASRAGQGAGGGYMKVLNSMVENVKHVFWLYGTESPADHMDRDTRSGVI